MEKKQYLTDGEVVFLPVSEEYLTDESGGMGWAEQICFPTTAGEVSVALAPAPLARGAGGGARGPKINKRPRGGLGPPG